jgi:hypothetical protein
MKIALCLHGYFANAGGTEASERAHKYISRKLLNNRDVDVFVHTWDTPANQQKIIDLYAPERMESEVQNNFTEELTKFDEDWFNEGFARGETMYNTNTIFRGLSFLYSRKRAVELKREHEQEKGFEYDCVILARFDLGTRGKEHYQIYYATNINFDDRLDMNYLYSAYWDQLNHGYADHWFYSNSKNMDLVGGLYDRVFEYYQTDSGYTKAVTEGWPESNAQDEFSNERLKESKARTENLKVFERWGCIDNHKLYKWDFMQTGLHAKSKYIDITRDL